MRHNTETPQTGPACPICEGDSLFFVEDTLRKQLYFRCHACLTPFLDPKLRLGPADERERYELHDNDLSAPGYQEFLRPLADLVRKHEKAGTRGLDFGCGPTQSFKQILSKDGFQMQAFDSFFWNQPEVLNQSFDFIVASEVFEHLYDPRAETLRLGQTLKPGGRLWLMTSSFDSDAKAFGDWYYRRDPSHVIFYSVKGLTALAQACGFEAPQVYSNKLFSLAKR